MNLTKILFTVGQSVIIYFIVWGFLEGIYKFWENN